MLWQLFQVALVLGERFKMGWLCPHERLRLEELSYPTEKPRADRRAVRVVRRMLITTDHLGFRRIPGVGVGYLRQTDSTGAGVGGEVVVGVASVLAVHAFDHINWNNSCHTYLGLRVYEYS